MCPQHPEKARQGCCISPPVQCKWFVCSDNFNPSCASPWQTAPEQQTSQGNEMGTVEVDRAGMQHVAQISHIWARALQVGPVEELTKQEFSAVEMAWHLRTLTALAELGFPAPMCQLITTCNSVPRNVIPSNFYRHMLTYGVHKPIQVHIHTYK